MFDATNIKLDNWEGFRSARKRPIKIHAVQMLLPEGFFVDTLEGRMKGEPGDYLVIGVEGESYPVKQTIFEKTYDFIEENQEKSP